MNIEMSNISNFQIRNHALSLRECFEKHERENFSPFLSRNRGSGLGREIRAADFLAI
jgi:hypothetical protein